MDARQPTVALPFPQVPQSSGSSAIVAGWGQEEGRALCFLFLCSLTADTMVMHSEGQDRQEAHSRGQYYAHKYYQ